MFGGMGNMGNMAGMMKKVQKMQSEMKKMQDELKRKTIDVTAGGGAVKVVMNGEKQVQSLTIDPAAVDPEDVEMLQDLLSAAFNEATKKVDEMMAAEMGSKAMPLRSSCWPMAEMMAAISSGGAPQSRRNWKAMRAPVWAWSSRLMLLPKSCM